MESMTTYTMTTDIWYDNETWSYMPYYDGDKFKLLAEEMAQLDKERRMFSYVHYGFAGCIVTLNALMVVSILMSQKQRRHLRTWLILHMTFLHILFAAVALPFEAVKVTTPAAGLGENVAACKFLYFLSDVLQYMLNVSIGMLGIYQCLNVVSQRLLKSVSNVLSVSILVILPWLIVTMLTAVLRLTMSEEQWGQCYIVSDTTARNLWFILAYCIPMAIVAVGLVTIVTIGFTKFKSKLSPSQGISNQVTMFVTICLALCFFMRLPFYVISYLPVRTYCQDYNGALLCARITQGLDTARLLSMVFIPLTYLIPREIVARCRKIRSKLQCRSVECSTSAKKQPTMELKSVPANERTLL